MCCNCSEYLILAQAPNFRYSWKCRSELGLVVGCGGGDGRLKENKWAWVKTVKGLFQLINVDKDNVGGSASFGKLNGIGKLEIVKPEEIEEVL